MHTFGTIVVYTLFLLGAVTAIRSIVLDALRGPCAKIFPKWVAPKVTHLHLLVAAHKMSLALQDLSCRISREFPPLVPESLQPRRCLVTQESEGVFLVLLQDTSARRWVKVSSTGRALWTDAPPDSTCAQKLSHESVLHIAVAYDLCVHYPETRAWVLNHEVPA